MHVVGCMQPSSKTRNTVSRDADPSVAARAFATLSETVRDYGIVLLDAEGLITFWGEGARQLYAWTADEAEGAHLRMLYPIAGAEDGAAESHLSMAKKEGFYEGEGRRVARDGSSFHTSSTLDALWNDAGDLLGYVSITRRPTGGGNQAAPRETASPESAAAPGTATNAAAAIAFLATVSHEIRTPVNAILGYHELLELGLAGPLAETQRKYIERASAAGRHLLSIVDEVLDFAKLDGDRIQASREAILIAAVMHDALALVAPQARQRGVAITNASGRAAQQIATWGDPGRVKQILVNLLSNAIKFTEPRDGNRGRLTISTAVVDQLPPDARVSTAGPWAYLRVEDTGPGIPPDRLEAIFEPFVQGDPALTRRYGGSGLGLAISRRLARLMGGDLTARSDVGMGSTFLLWLPAAPLEAVGVPRSGERRAVKRPDVDVVAPLLEPSELPDRAGILVQVSDTIIDRLETILARYLDRLRTDPLTPSAREVSSSRIEDHLASFLADLAATIASMEVKDHELTDLLLDSSAIQRTIAMKHGEQRARLGWHADEIRREYQIIEEELTDAIRRAGPSLHDGAEGADSSNEVNAALAFLSRFLAAALRRSLASYRAARAQQAQNA
jgi:signal transduction histidine kinase